MSTRKNITFNYLGTAVVTLTPLLVIPYYIHILGYHYWGLISFIALLQSIFTLLNAGMSQFLVREFSWLAADAGKNRDELISLFLGFETIYWAISLSGALIICLFSSFIITHWLTLDSIPSNIGQMTLYSAAAMLAVQLPLSVYRSVLIGCNGQVKQNVLMATFTLFRHLGAVVVLALWKDFAYYLAWIILSAMVETHFTRQASQIAVDIPKLRPPVTWSEIKKRAASSLGLSFSVMLGLLALQVDKLVISGLLSIEQLGFYSIASAVASGMLQLLSPIAAAALPKVVQLQNRSQIQRSLNLKLFLATLAIGILMLAAFLLIGRPVLIFWLRDEHIAMIVFPVLSLLLVGNLMNGLYNVGYINWLAADSSSKIFRVNLLSLILALLLVPICISSYGLTGAAIGWIILNGIGLIYSLDWLIKKEMHA